MSDQPSIMICLRVSGRPAALTHGSMQRLCAVCGAGIWVGRASLLLALEAGAKLLCSECALRSIAEDGEPPTIMPPTEAQLREIAESEQRRADDQ